MIIFMESFFIICLIDLQTCPTILTILNII